ncbi:MAG: methylated-DNA--[protein]-cysteine S-methyltransferase, partial [Candidatus Rokubacteria bacterium]|nr:methylated-DNA--[protein]-cysteine S-methyltransferase [Candidatus Rokubacteria bacterium]
AGRRAVFSVPLDLAGVPEFQRKVLRVAARVAFGEVASYAALARRIGHPGAARAVGNALGANPVPLLIPCHRIVRGDGTWGPYALGPRWKTRLLAFERSRPAGRTRAGGATIGA